MPGGLETMHFRDETSKTFYLRKIQLRRNNSADIKCKQLTSTRQEQHRSYTTQHPQCVVSLKIRYKKMKDLD